MAKLSMKQIREEMRALGFEYVSGTYTNLKSVLVVKCREGHENTTTLHDLRKKRPCPVCMQFEVTKEEEKMLSELPKKKGYRILALDNATIITGYSIIEDGKLIHYGIKEIDSSTKQNLRIAYMKQWFVSMLTIWDIDSVGLENVQYQGNAQTLISLSKLLGALEVASLEYNIEPYIVSSQTWKSFCKVKGRTRAQDKENAQNHVKQKYGIIVSEDVADAICLGEYVAAQARYGEEITW